MFKFFRKIREARTIQRNLGAAYRLKDEAWTWHGSTMFAGHRDEWLRTAPIREIALSIGRA